MRRSTLSKAPYYIRQASPILRIVAVCLVFAAVAARFWLRYFANRDVSIDALFGTDFRVYYFGALLEQQGFDAYDARALAAITPYSAGSPFVYPPFWLFIFRPLLALPLTAAFYAWCAIKFAVLLIGWRGWRRAFGEFLPPYFFLLFCAGAFGSALPYDFLTGNVTVIEFALLGWACVGFMQNRARPAAVAIVLASGVKLLPLLFLAVPVMIRRDRRTFITAALIALAAGAILAIDALLQPVEFARWLGSLHYVYWVGTSLFSFVLVLLQSYSSSADTLIALRVPHVIYAALAMIVVATTFFELKRKPPLPLAVALACLGVFLCFPRVWLYSYTTVIPATTVIIVMAARQGGVLRWVAVALTIILFVLRDGLPVEFLGTVFSRFYELYAMIGVWLLALAVCRRSCQPMAGTAQTM